MEDYKDCDELIKDILLGILACLAAVGCFFLMAIALGGEIIFK